MRFKLVRSPPSLYRYKLRKSLPLGMVFKHVILSLLKR